MAEQVLLWTPSTPALPDLDNGGLLTVGTLFSLSMNAPILGVQWRVPNTLPASGSPDSQIALWTSGGALLDFANVTWTAPMAGTYQSFYFSVPFAGIGGTSYMASMFTRNRYVATTNYTWPQTTGIITADANNGWFFAGAGFPVTQSGNAATYYVSPIVQVGSPRNSSFMPFF